MLKVQKKLGGWNFRTNIYFLQEKKSPYKTSKYYSKTNCESPAACYSQWLWLQTLSMCKAGPRPQIGTSLPKHHLFSMHFTEWTEPRASRGCTCKEFPGPSSEWSFLLRKGHWKLFLSQERKPPNHISLALIFFSFLPQRTKGDQFGGCVCSCSWTPSHILSCFFVFLSWNPQNKKIICQRP